MKRIYSAILLGMLLLCIAGCGGPTQVVRQYVKKNIEGDWDGAKSYTTGDVLAMFEFQEKLATTMGIDLNDIDPSKFGVNWRDLKSDINFNLQDMTGDKAEVYVNAGGERITFYLVNIGGQWKIENFSIPELGDVSDLMSVMEQLPKMR